jgi:hypothetical protein
MAEYLDIWRATRGQGEGGSRSGKKAALRNLNWGSCRGVGAASFAALAVGEEAV